MKKFAETYSGGILVTAAVLFLTVCSLCAYIYIDFRADDEVVRSQEHLQETLLKTSLRRLEAALSEENRMTSYHFALTAAEYAASAGQGTEAAFFRKISTGIADGADNMPDIAAAVQSYLDTGRMPEEFTILYESADTLSGDVLTGDPVSVSYAREQAARECAASILGANGILRAAERHPAGGYLYTCRNAYAVVDARSGTPIEAGISSDVSDGTHRLSEEDCVERAYSFLSEYFRIDTVRSAALVSAVPDPVAGTYELTYRSGGRTICLSVRRDTGRVVRLIAR